MASYSGRWSVKCSLTRTRPHSYRKSTIPGWQPPQSLAALMMITLLQPGVVSFANNCLSIVASILCHVFRAVVGDFHKSHLLLVRLKDQISTCTSLSIIKLLASRIFSGSGRIARSKYHPASEVDPLIRSSTSPLTRSLSAISGGMHSPLTPGEGSLFYVGCTELTVNGSDAQTTLRHSKYLKIHSKTLIFSLATIPRI